MTATQAPGPLLTSVASGAPIIETIDVAKRYTLGKGLIRKGRILRAVDGVSVAVQRSETLGLIGESGSGKSTLGRAMLRLLPIDEGVIRFAGDDITSMKGESLRLLRRRMNLVFQNPHSAVNRRRRVHAIIREPLDAFAVGSSAERETQVNELLDRVGLPRRLRDRYPHELSGGQLQRVVIARAVATKPEFVVADEPTASLDMSIRAQVINLLLDLKAEFDLSMVFVSHDLRTVSHMSDRIAVMYLGRIVEQGPGRSIETDPLHPYTANLIAALPKMVGGGDRRTVAPGDMPSALDMPSGCRYNTRCPFATDVCRSDYPVLEEKQPGRLVACHHVPVQIRMRPL